jgi:hypothetical protein
MANKKSNKSTFSNWSDQKNSIFKLDYDVENNVLVYPNRMRSLINEGTPNSTKDPISFVLFRPMIIQQQYPTWEEQEKSGDQKLDANTQSTKEKIIPPEGVRAIILPIRPVTDSITADWQPVEGMGFGSVGDYIKWKGYKAITGVLGGMIPSEVAIAAKSKFFGGGIDNPHSKLMFAGHQRRNFEIAWDFLKPENEQDEKDLESIISIFKKCMIGGYGKYVIFPNMFWEVSFYSMPNYKAFFRYKKAVILNCTNPMGGSGDEFKAMESGLPFMSLQLSVGEYNFPTVADVGLRVGK